MLLKSRKVSKLSASRPKVQRFYIVKISQALLTLALATESHFLARCFDARRASERLYSRFKLFSRRNLFPIRAGMNLAFFTSGLGNVICFIPPACPGGIGQGRRRFPCSRSGGVRGAARAARRKDHLPLPRPIGWLRHLRLSPPQAPLSALPLSS